MSEHQLNNEKDSTTTKMAALEETPISTGVLEPVSGRESGEKNEFVDKAEAPPAPAAAPSIQYPGAFVSAVLNLALLLALFLVALDMSIVATAIPTITEEFHSVDQIGWYGSAFFLCLAAFQAFWGKAYKFFPLKIVFLTCIGIFEIGSLIAALAPNSPGLIVARAIQGTGGAGVTGGVYTLIAFITRPKHRPVIVGLSSTVWSLSSVLGPILGGVFTQYVTWRWCFWINLPVGGTTMILIFLFFKTPPHSRVAHAKLADLPFLFDIPGVVLLIAGMTCLLLALEDGGITRPWNSSVPIGLLVGFGVIMIAFFLVEWKQGERAMIVPRIMKRRTILALGLFNLTAQGSGFARTYNLPLYFQAAQGVSASESGVRTLPTVLATSIFSFISSIALGKLGYYQPFLIVGAIFLTVGSGMIYTLVPSSSAGKYIGYQILAAVGSGLIIQINVMVAQAISPFVDLAVTVAIVLFWQFVGGTIGVSAAQSIMNNVVIKSLPRDNPRITPDSVLAAGANGLKKVFPDPTDRALVVDAYMDGLRAAWIWNIALSGAAFLVAFLAERKSIKAEDIKKRAAAKAADKEKAAA